MLLKMKRNAIDNYSSTIIGENHNYLGKQRYLVLQVYVNSFLWFPSRILPVEKQISMPHPHPCPKGLSYLFWTAITNYHRWDGLNNRN